MLIFVFNIYTALFLSKLLFIVCCTAFSLHICLFTRGAILLGIESAPLSEEEEYSVSIGTGVLGDQKVVRENSEIRA